MIEFSIIVPVYNVEDFIQECIESILNQTYKNFELILINDGSTDKSASICKDLSKLDERIKFFSQENKGLLKTRIEGMKKSTGDYILFVDSDDFIDKTLLETANKNILDHKVDLILYRYRRVNENNEIMYIQDEIFENNTIIEKHENYKLFEKVISSSNLNNIWNKIFKKDIFEINYPHNIINGEDLAISIPILYNSKKTIYINNVLYNYRYSYSSITNNFNRYRYRDINLVRSFLYDNYLHNFKEYKKEIDYNFYKYYIISIMNYIFDLLASSLKKEEVLEIVNEIKNQDDILRIALNNVNKYSLNTKYKYLIVLYNMNALIYFRSVIQLYVNIKVLIKKVIFNTRGF